MWGVDYGSKLAGTTVIASWNGKEVTFECSQKKKDADALILQKASSERPTHIFLDAPLSLPNVYKGIEGYDDYFYRKLDREVGGMSPMFLGGLTARAIRLKSQLEPLGIEVIETYPALLARHFNLKVLHYKKQVVHIQPVVEYLRKKFPTDFVFDLHLIRSWHMVDGLLAAFSAYRFERGQHIQLGDMNEGWLVY